MDDRFQPVEAGDLGNLFFPRSTRIELKAEFQLQGKHFLDLGSLRKKPTFTQTCPFLNSGHSGHPCESDLSVAPGPRKQLFDTALQICFLRYVKGQPVH
jgi:hypothetical protein